jgi:hypothetical protein
MSARAPRTEVKNKFSTAEDARLAEVVNLLGCRDWAEVAAHIPRRNPRQCRERWKNYVNPTIMRLPWSPSEEALLEEKLAQLGPKWQVIAKFFPNRSRNYVKNHWMTKQRRLQKRNRKVELTTVAPPASPVQPPPFQTKFSVDDLFRYNEEEDTLWHPSASGFF